MNKLRRGMRNCVSKADEPKIEQQPENVKRKLEYYHIPTERLGKMVVTQEFRKYWYLKPGARIKSERNTSKAFSSTNSNTV